MIDLINIFGAAYAAYLVYKLVWLFLPDNCEHEECSRNGIRGEEDTLNGKVICIPCKQRELRKMELLESLRREW